MLSNEEKKMIKGLAQDVIDMSILFAPISGMAMALTGGNAKKVCDHFEIEFEAKAQQYIVEAQFSYNDKILKVHRSNLEDENVKLKKLIEEMRLEILPKMHCNVEAKKLQWAWIRKVKGL